ncbi:MAG: hypothetical protein HPY75_03080 [Actinobacteria bacterium]|nr:hypothetical protein [Actinomycetota bacterium]
MRFLFSWPASYAPSETATRRPGPDEGGKCCYKPGNDRVGRREAALDGVSFLLAGLVRAERDRYPTARAG